MSAPSERERSPLAPEVVRLLEQQLRGAGRSAAPNLVAHHAVDINVPIGCAGVMVGPGDILVGDELEEREEFILEKIRADAPPRGTYPPDEPTLAEYERRRSQRDQRG